MVKAKNSSIVKLCCSMMYIPTLYLYIPLPSITYLLVFFIWCEISHSSIFCCYDDNPIEMLHNWVISTPQWGPFVTPSYANFWGEKNGNKCELYDRNRPAEQGHILDDNRHFSIFIPGQCSWQLDKNFVLKDTFLFS